jgi:tetratricopeptide (TPR) repeat protein
MQLAITIDPGNHQAYIGIGSAYEKAGEYEKALEWQETGLSKAPEEVKATMSLSIGYTYISMDKYCDAIPHLRAYVDANPTDTTWVYNLSICYNNCGYYDSALILYRQLVEMDSTNVKVLSGIGRYFNDKGRRASDSARFYQDAGDTAMVNQWHAQRDRVFDSSRVYFKRAFNLDATDEFVADMYALVSALRGEFDDAAEGYLRLTELQPDNANNWIYLGDIRLRQNRLEEATTAYEQAVELKPDRKEIWQNLVDLYHDQGMTQKEAEAKEKLEALK